MVRLVIQCPNGESSRSSANSHDKSARCEMPRQRTYAGAMLGSMTSISNVTGKHATCQSTEYMIHITHGTQGLSQQGL